jgi:hypothetical protein
MELDPGFAGVTKAERDRLLQCAVVADRHHLANPALNPDDYLNAALELMAFDRRYGTWAPGSPGPGSATWSDDDGPLEYVRAQWADGGEQPYC